MLKRHQFERRHFARAPPLSASASDSCVCFDRAREREREQDRKRENEYLLERKSARVHYSRALAHSPLPSLCQAVARTTVWYWQPNEPSALDTLKASEWERPARGRLGTTRRRLTSAASPELRWEFRWEFRWDANSDVHFAIVYGARGARDPFAACLAGNMLRSRPSVDSTL